MKLQHYLFFLLALCTLTSCQLNSEYESIDVIFNEEIRVIHNEDISVMWGRDVFVPSVETAMTYINPMIVAFCRIDYDLARDRGLIGASNRLTNTYLTAQAIYKAAFYQYLVEIADIGQYERILDESDYNFIPVEGYFRQHLYQRYGSFGNRFIYIRNNFHIERLHPDDLEILLDASDKDALVELAARTYRDVIRILPGIQDVIYDAGIRYPAPSNALLIYMSFRMEFDQAGMIICRENERIKDELASDLAIQMRKELTEALGHPVVVLIY